MNINPFILSNAIKTVKTEPNDESIIPFKNHLNEHQQEILRLQTVHEEQIFKLCNELEKSSLLLYNCKCELDSMRVINLTKDKQIERINLELINLKNDFEFLTTKYQTLFNEMQDARQYLMKMIDSLD